MKISVFIPSHNPINLDRAVESVRKQTGTSGIEVEIVVLLNNGAQWQPINLQWKNIIVHRDETGNQKIGWLKALACKMCSGDVFVELDHDDELMPGCLEWIAFTARVERLANPKVFLFSPTHELRKNGTGVWYGNEYGWEHATADGLTYNVPFDVTARSLCEIFYAPNHVRAWTREAYEAAGGHDVNMECGDDHDLMIRTYLNGATFLCAPRPLYYQHYHGENSQHGERNARIQTQQAANRDKYLTPLIHEWCKRSNLAMLDLGGAFSCPDGYLPVDVLEPRGASGKWIDWDVACDGVPELLTVNAKALTSFIGIGCIRAKDFLEHIPQRHVIDTMNSIHEALVPGGWLLSMTPSTDGRGAFQDPTHVSFWNENSWLYYTQEAQAKYVPAITAKFQSVQCSTFFPTEWERAKDIPYVQFNGCALHGQRQAGLIGFPRR